MLYSDYLKQERAALDKHFAGQKNMVKVKDNRSIHGYMYMPKGMADGTDHTKYYNAAQAWRAGGRVGKYTPPNLAEGETQGRIGSSRRRRTPSSRADSLRGQVNQRRARAMALLRKRQQEQQDRRKNQQQMAAAAEANRQHAAKRRQQRVARAVGGGPRSQVNSQNYYRPPVFNTGGDNSPPNYASAGLLPGLSGYYSGLGGGGMGGASLFQQAMMRGFRPPPRQPYVTQRSAAGTPRASRPGRAVNFNAPNPGLSRAQGLRGRALRGIQRNRMNGYRGMYY